MINSKQNILLLLLISILLSCSNKETTISFNKNKKVIEIPFEYNIYGKMHTKCTINKDTIVFIFDLGSEVNIVPTNIDGQITARHTNVTDVYNFEKKHSIYRIKKVKWGDLIFENFHALKDDMLLVKKQGLIGNKVLKNMCIKIDNTKNVILLSKDPKQIEKKGIVRSFDPNTFTVKLTDEAGLNNKDFLFDTGFYGDIAIDTIFEHVDVSTWKMRKIGAFTSNYKEKYTTTSFYMYKLQWDTITYNNILCKYNKTVNSNIIGTAFIRRFKSVTLDCINKKVYFELPKDRPQMTFSSKVINDIATAPLELIYQRFASLGLGFYQKSPLTVGEINLDKKYGNIKIGDTVIGVDSAIFEKYVYDVIPNKHKYYLETDTNKQSTKLSNIFYKKNNTTFHFYKNGKLLSLRAQRDSIPDFAPKLAYGYNLKKEEMLYFPIKFNLKKDITNKFMLCVPYSTFTGKEITISIVENGKKKTISNKID